MRNLDRENKELWLPFLTELREEILTKGLLTEYTNKIKKDKKKNKKEEGHTNAQSYVDYLTDNVFPYCETINKYGFEMIIPEKSRDHGDFHLVDSESKTIIKCNGKFGASKNLSGPNVCAITRAFGYLTENCLPYIIFKFRFYKGEYRFDVFDLYNNADVITYDDGPGQLMIKEKKFYEKKRI